jgi:hypothetical protein
MDIISTVLRGASAAGIAVALAACGSDQGAAVPSLAGATTAASSGTQSHALHVAAQCIRDNGIPKYQDPVVDPNGDVYTDQRPLQDASDSVVRHAMSACRDQITRANFNSANEPRATPELVQAGVRSAQCLRAHGLPNVADPTASTGFTPGHGFGMSGTELPPGGKTNGVVQQAFHACRALLDQEITMSTLAMLGHG